MTDKIFYNFFLISCILIIGVLVVSMVIATPYEQFGDDRAEKLKALKGISANAYISLATILIVIVRLLDLITEDVFKLLFYAGLGGLGINLSRIWDKKELE